MHFEIAIVAVGFARQQRFQFAARDFDFELAQARFRFGDGFGVVLALAKLDQSDLIVELLLDPGERGDLLVERGALLHQPACPLRIVPQIGVFGLPVQFGQSRARFVEVKDASSAAPMTA